MKSCVYFIYDRKEDLIKIGWTRDVIRRLKDLKREYRTNELEIIYVIPGEGPKLERMLHQYFKRYKVTRLLSIEWYRSKPVLRFINKLKNILPFKLTYLTNCTNYLVNSDDLILCSIYFSNNLILKSELDAWEVEY